MLERTDIAYAYDGSFDGLMCCVFEAFEKKESPALLLSPGRDQLCLFELRPIQTDPMKADRVTAGVAKRVCMPALELVEQGYLCRAEEIDLHILRFLRLAFRVGPPVLDMLTEPAVDALFRAVRHLSGEAHLLKGFIRFREAGGALLAEIEPKNRVLPLLRAHFCDRFGGELFMIYDKTHREALVHQDGRSGIFPMELLDLPAISDGERYLRAMWQRFYSTIGISERENPACRRSHMPKRYWDHMLEMNAELGKPQEIWYNREVLAGETAGRGPAPRPRDLIP